MTHNSHASGLGDEHSEDRPGNYITYPVLFSNSFPITLHISVLPGINCVSILSPFSVGRGLWEVWEPNTKMTAYMGFFFFSLGHYLGAKKMKV